MVKTRKVYVGGIGYVEVTVGADGPTRTRKSGRINPDMMESLEKCETSELFEILSEGGISHSQKNCINQILESRGF